MRSVLTARNAAGQISERGLVSAGMVVSAGAAACAFIYTNIEALASLVHAAISTVLSWVVARSFFAAMEWAIAGSIDIVAVVPWNPCELVLSIAVALVPSLCIIVTERKRKMPYQVFCRQLDGSSVTLEVCSDDKICDIKKKLEHKMGVPAGLQCLVWSGKVLDDSHSLFWYSIRKEATLHLHNQLRGGGPKSDSETSSSAAEAAGAQTWTALR